MLNDAEEERFEHVVSWLPGGRAFKVHQTEQFVNTIMPRYFNQTKYKSFGRQVSTRLFHGLVGSLFVCVIGNEYTHSSFVVVLLLYSILSSFRSSLRC